MLVFNAQRHDLEPRLIFESLLMPEDQVEKLTAACMLLVKRQRREYETSDDGYLVWHVDEVGLR